MATDDPNARKKALVDFAAWKVRLLAQDQCVPQATCSAWWGTGSVECPCCHEGEIECEECGGSGKTEFPTFEDFTRLRRIEEALLGFWNRGGPIHKLASWDGAPVLPGFLVEGVDALNRDDPAHDATAPSCAIRIRVRP